MEKYEYKNLLTKSIARFKSDGFYRNFTPILRKIDSFPLTNLKFSNDQESKDKLKIWCTNDYLNMSHNQEVINRMIEVIKEVGTGFECGISIKDFMDFKEKDVIESYLSEEIRRSI